MILCERFPSLNPLQLQEYEAVEVFKLIRNVNRNTEIHKDDEPETKQQNQGNKKRKKNIMVKVMD